MYFLNLGLKGLNMDGDIAIKDKNVSQDEPEKTDVRGMTVSWFPVRKIR